MTPSPEAIRANEELLERMATTDARNFDPKNRVLTGRSLLSSPSSHPDARMSLTLADMVSCYNPPQKPLKEVRTVTKREHKTQAQTEAEDLNVKQ